MTLEEWMSGRDVSDRQVAEMITNEMLTEDEQASEVSVPAVQKYRTGQVPGRPRMRAIHKITKGWVTANDFYGLDVVD